MNFTCLLGLDNLALNAYVRVWCDVFFPSKQAGSLNGSLDCH